MTLQNARTAAYRAAMPLAALAFTLFGAPAQAAIIAPGTYQLHNHPGGKAAPPGYGLRLDELQDLTDNHDIFTFDFDAPGAAMYMDFDGTTAHIYGTAFGGLDTGSGYDPLYSGYATVDFMYSTVTPVVGDDDFHVVTPDYTNSGSINITGPWSVNQALYDYAGNFGYTFRLGDEDHDEGFDGYAGISGWGWMTYTTDGISIEYIDWKFTATLIPAPPVLAAALLPLLGRARGRRRQ